MILLGALAYSFGHYFVNNTLRSIYLDISTHYMNLAYEIEVKETPNLPDMHNSEYQWLAINELLKSKQVRKNVKDYFRD